MPTETKNNTAKASRNGNVSLAAWWLNSDSLSSMPAKNAPSANDTPNNSAEPNATPSAIASTHNVNSSREPVPATRSRIHGITRLPTRSISAMDAPTLRNVVNSAVSTEVASAASPLSSPASAGSSTSASTQA